MSPDASLVGPFSRACGLDGPFRLIVEGPNGVEIRDLVAPFIVVGRDPSADLVLDHPAVGHRHAYLQVVAGHVFAVALGTRRELTWDGERRESGWVVGGQAIGVGPFRLRLGMPTPGDRPPPPAPTTRAFSCPGMVDLALGFSGPDPTPGSWQVSRALVLLGHSPRCRVQLPRPGVASIHAALVRTAEGAWLVDLLGPGGIEVADRAERFALVGDGSIRVGHHVIGVRLGRPTTSDTEIEINLPAIRAVSAPPHRRTPSDPNLLPIIEEFGRMQDRMADQFQQALMTMFRHFSGMHQEQMVLIRQELARIHDLTAQQKALEARLAGLPSATPGDLRSGSQAARSGSSPQEPRPRIAPNPKSESLAPAELHVLLTHRLAALGEERQNLWQKLMTRLVSPSPDRVSP